MRTRFIVLIIILFPFCVNAQIKYEGNPGVNPYAVNDNKRSPEVINYPTVKPLYRNRIEVVQAKLAKEEQKLIKLDRNAWEIQSKIKKEKENIKVIKNTSDKINDSSIQKKIENSEKKIVKYQDKLKKAKKEIDLSFKKVEDLEKAIDQVRVNREEDFD